MCPEKKKQYETQWTNTTVNKETRNHFIFSGYTNNTPRHWQTDGQMDRQMDGRQTNRLTQMFIQS